MAKYVAAEARLNVAILLMWLMHLKLSNRQLQSR
jgi:hypothetical protein